MDGTHLVSSRLSAPLFKLERARDSLPLGDSWSSCFPPAPPYLNISFQSWWWEWLRLPSAAQQILSYLITLLWFIKETEGMTAVSLPPSLQSALQHALHSPAEIRQYLQVFPLFHQFSFSFLMFSFFPQWRRTTLTLCVRVSVHIHESFCFHVKGNIWSARAMK